MPCDMRRALQSMAVDVPGQSRVRVDEAGYVIGEGFESDAGCLAVEEPSLAQIGPERGGEIGRRAAQGGGNLGFAGNAWIENLGLRNLDARAEVHRVAAVFPIELRRSMLSARHKVREAEPAAGRQPRGAGQVERSAGGPVEHRKAGRELGYIRVNGCAQGAIARRAVQIGGYARFALKRAACEQREAA